MNQNRISPEQVAQATQTPQQRMTMEQLQKTQVLNLEDFKATTRIEKLSSQRPAKIVAMLGVMLIAMGILFPSFQSLSERGNTDKTNTEFREQSNNNTATKKPDKVVKDLNCKLEKLGLENGTDEIVNIYLTFNDDNLTNSTKEFILRKSASATEEPAILATYLQALQSYLTLQIPGYTLSVENIENGSVTKSVVDYTSLSYDDVPALIQTNPWFSVPFSSGTTMDDARIGLETQGYICE